MLLPPPHTKQSRCESYVHLADQTYGPGVVTSRELVARSFCGPSGVLLLDPSRHLRNGFHFHFSMVSHGNKIVILKILQSGVTRSELPECSFVFQVHRLLYRMEEVSCQTRRHKKEYCVWSCDVIR